jgi:hypothetical protein
MFHLHLSRNLRSLAFVLVTAAIAAAIGTLWWANRTGLPDSWRALIERELGQEGLHMKMGSLSYLPLQGVVATDVRVFSDADMRHEISHLERVLLDFDKTKLARGEVHLNKIQLRNARLALPLDEEQPGRGSLEVAGAYGTLLMPGDNRFEIRDASGRVSGIDVSLNARLTSRRPTGQPGESDAARGQRRQLFADILEELGRWDFGSAEPPKLKVFLEADANNRDALDAKLTLDAREIGKNGHWLENLSVHAEVVGELLTLTHIETADSRGRLNGRLDYDIQSREGRFDVNTTLDIAPLMSAWFGLAQPGGLAINGGQTLDAQGGFRIVKDKAPEIHMTGQAYAESVILQGVMFDSVESSYAWRDGSLFLRDSRLVRPDGQVTGKALIQWPIVRMALHGTLPARVYKPFFTGQPLERVIEDFTERENALFDVNIEGGFDATDRHSWAYSGSGSVSRVNYRGVPVDSATCKFTLNHHELDFHDGTVVFNHRDYKLRRDFEGPLQTTAKVGRIRYVAAEKIVQIENVAGDIWAAPLVRLFAPNIADDLEAYRFHKPPAMRGDGVVDVTPAGRTRLDVSFRSTAAADYDFLGEKITLSEPSGSVQVRGPRVLVRNLRMSSFGGPLSATFTHQGNRVLDGEITWTRLDLTALTSTYGYSMKNGGQFTGRIEFTMTGGEVNTMKGEGLFALEKTELFSVPVFGPLSPLISGVLKDRRAGFERAKDGFCTFRIRDGVLRSSDFHTRTASLNFAGEGEVDLAARTIDMTMRMNARGLLGLITLPLRPFYGMFQFRGTGPLKKPVWENVMFSTPSAEQDQLLRDPPKAQIVPTGG